MHNIHLIRPITRLCPPRPHTTSLIDCQSAVPLRKPAAQQLFMNRLRACARIRTRASVHSVLAHESCGFLLAKLTAHKTVAAAAAGADGEIIIFVCSIHARPERKRACVLCCDLYATALRFYGLPRNCVSLVFSGYYAVVRLCYASSQLDARSAAPDGGGRAAKEGGCF